MGSLPFMRPNAFYVKPVVREGRGGRILVSADPERKP
jgi:hypothetical protein